MRDELSDIVVAYLTAAQLFEPTTRGSDADCGNRETRWTARLFYTRRAMDDPLVTVLIPTHDHGDLIEFPLRSVLNQTLQDFEVFVAGDGMTDEGRACPRPGEATPRLASGRRMPTRRGTSPSGS